jgi:hypothetical protein
MNATQLEAVKQLELRLYNSAHGARRACVLDAAAKLGVSVQTVYRWLSQVEVKPIVKRKRRSDFGACKIPEETLVHIAGAMKEVFRANGKKSVPDAQLLEVLSENGTPIAAHVSTVTRQLRRLGLHPDQVNRPTPSVEMRSPHPNWAWQVDPSVCTAYYLSNATGLQVMDVEEFNKNKPKNFSRIAHERLLRYVVTDHYSGAILVRYYIGSESADNLSEFLVWCFGPKRHPDGSQAHLVHGVPFVMSMDKGSANTSHQVLTMLDNLDVSVLVHARGNSRAKGSVEVAQNIVERGLESRLRFNHVDSIDHLNALAVQWSHRFNAEAIHTRFAGTRYSLWQKIRAEQLRVAPNADVLRDLVNSHVKERRVSNDLRIQFQAIKGERSFDYDVALVPGVMAGAKVSVRVNAYARPAINVAYFDDAHVQRWLTVAPIERDDSGFMVEAPTVGVSFRSAHKGLIDHNREMLMLRAYGHAIPDAATTHTERLEAAEKAKEKGALIYGGAIDAFKSIEEANLPTFMPPRGTPLDVSHLEVVDPPIDTKPLRPVQDRVWRAERVRRVSAYEGCKLILRRLEQAGAAQAYDGPTMFAWIEAKYSAEGGMPEDDVPAIVRQLINNQELPAPVPADTPPVLRAVGDE